MGILKKIWDMLPEGRPICVPKPEAWGVKQEEEKETDNDLKKKDDVEKEKNLKKSKRRSSYDVICNICISCRYCDRNSLCEKGN